MEIKYAKDLTFLPASHEDMSNPGVFKKVLLVKDEITKGRIQMINWALLPKDKSFRAHYHEDMDEIFILVSGKVMMRVDKEEEKMNKGDFVLVPMNSIHKMTNISEADVEYIVIGVTRELGGKTVVTEK